MKPVDVDVVSAADDGVRLDDRQFRELLARVADGWSTGNPRQAAEAFAEDAVYIEPPDRQRYVGREELYAFFHGGGAEPRPMRMTWHAIAFDAERQAGFGEYTFQRPGLQLHGIVAVALVDGKIAGWREYQYRSDRPFEDFAGDSLRAGGVAGSSPQLRGGEAGSESHSA